MAKLCIISAYPATDLVGPTLVEAYAAGAKKAGHGVGAFDVHTLRMGPAAPVFQPQGASALEPASNAAVQRIKSADHLVLFVPVHRSYVLPVLQTFVSQVFVTDAFGQPHPAVWGSTPFLNLRTARIISTLDAESWAEFQRTRTARFHPLKKSVLEVMGFKKVRTTTVPPIYDESAANPFLQKWIGKMDALGQASF